MNLVFLQPEEGAVRHYRPLRHFSRSSQPNVTSLREKSLLDPQPRYPANNTCLSLQCFRTLNRRNQTNLRQPVFYAGGTTYKDVVCDRPSSRKNICGFQFYPIFSAEAKNNTRIAGAAFEAVKSPFQRSKRYIRVQRAAPNSKERFKTPSNHRGALNQGTPPFPGRNRTASPSNRDISRVWRSLWTDIAPLT